MLCTEKTTGGDLYGYVPRVPTSVYTGPPTTDSNLYGITLLCVSSFRTSHIVKQLALNRDETGASLDLISDPREVERTKWSAKRCQNLPRF